ncbi:hypothetical protein DFJ73DRAFT_293589 [Zopfochytrium polystomum]|nr:hypothetical protein DFJ73DRAFT_293589 [Zopfochytrium polystomum]
MVEVQVVVLLVVFTVILAGCSCRIHQAAVARTAVMSAAASSSVQRTEIDQEPLPLYSPSPTDPPAPPQNSAEADGTAAACNFDRTYRDRHSERRGGSHWSRFDRGAVSSNTIARPSSVLAELAANIAFRLSVTFWISEAGVACLWDRLWIAGQGFGVAVNRQIQSDCRCAVYPLPCLYWCSRLLL